MGSLWHYMRCILWLCGPWLWRWSRIVHRYWWILKESRLLGDGRRLGRHYDRWGQVHRCWRSIWPSLRLRFLLVNGDPNMWNRSYMLSKEARATSGANLCCIRAVELVHYYTRRSGYSLLSHRTCLLRRLLGWSWIDWRIHGNSRNYARGSTLPMGDSFWTRCLRCTRHNIPNDLLTTNFSKNELLFYFHKLLLIKNF